MTSVVTGVVLFGELDFGQVAATAGQTMVVFDAVGLGLAVAVVRRRSLDERTRSAWYWLSAAAGLRLVSGVLFAVFASWHVFPAPGDAARLIMVPVMLVGLLRLPRGGGGPGDRARLALDVTAVLVGGAMVVWYAVAGPALAVYSLGNFHQLAAAICYPVGDLVLFFGLVVVAMRGRDRSIIAMVRLTIAALAAEAAGDAYLTYVSTHHDTERWLPWQFGCWVVGHALFLAGLYQVSRAPRPGGVSLRHRTDGGSQASTSRLPYLGNVVVVIVLITAAVRQGGVYPWFGLVVGAVLTTVVVTVRQAHLLRENHRLAVTDNLTGLANRAQLRGQMNMLLAHGARNGQRFAVLMADMNGFKQVNDTLGHAAGDQLLVAFAGILRRTVLGGDPVARLGGDEFVVVLRNVDEVAKVQAVVARIRSEMTVPLMIGDSLVEVQAAIGFAISESDDDVDSLLHRADEAMYEVKEAARSAHR